jgi:hypothetical protein
MRGDRVSSNSLQAAAAALNLEAYSNPPNDKKDGEAMTIRTRNSVRGERLQDLLMLSSFGFWAVLLGFTPVLAYHSLTS